MNYDGDSCAEVQDYITAEENLLTTFNIKTHKMQHFLTATLFTVSEMDREEMQR